MDRKLRLVMNVYEYDYEKKKIIFRPMKRVFLFSWIVALVLWAIIALVCRFTTSDWDENGIVVIILLALLFMGIVIYTGIGLLRRVTLDRTGCEICLWKIRRFYTWDEMWYRRWIYRNPHEQRKHKVSRGIIWFSNHAVEISTGSKRNLQSPLGIEECNAPLSCLCIHLTEKTAMPKRPTETLQMPKDDFLDFADSIGLKVQDIHYIR